MDVRVCKRCKSIFQHVTGPSVCPKCKIKEEEMFQVVKDYLRKNPGASMNIVSQETEVSVPMIESFLRQGRLEVAEGSPISISCEICGTKIYTGKMCAKCNMNLVGGLSEAAKEIRTDKLAEDLQNKKVEKMRFLRSDRIK